MTDEDDRIITAAMKERAPIRALCVDGPLRGSIQEMPKSGYVAIEHLPGQGVMDFGSATQRHYRPQRLWLFDREVWIASCSKGKPQEVDIFAALFSEEALTLLASAERIERHG